MNKTEILAKILDVGIPERYLKVKRTDFIAGHQIVKLIPEWVANGDCVAFTGQLATEFLAVVGKYVVVELGKVAKWISYTQLASSYKTYDEDGRVNVAYYSAIPVLLISDLKLGDPQFDAGLFLKERYAHKLPTFFSVFGVFYPASCQFVKKMEVK